VYEVDGGEWIDFVSSDLKHLSPRPERGARIAAVGAEAEAESETEEAPSADIIVHPSAEPVLEPAMAMADAAPAAEAAPQETPPRYDAASLTYEPDQERREKFLSRFSRWGKKGG
jgi:ribonuclease E